MQTQAVVTKSPPPAGRISFKMWPRLFIACGVLMTVAWISLLGLGVVTLVVKCSLE